MTGGDSGGAGIGGGERGSRFCFELLGLSFRVRDLLFSASESRSSLLTVRGALAPSSAGGDS